MSRRLLLFALLLIAIGVVGLGVFGCSSGANPFYAPGGGGMMRGDGMMGGGGMMGNGGMMGGQGFDYAPNVDATPPSIPQTPRPRGGTRCVPDLGGAGAGQAVPANQPIDREVDITARNLQFGPTRVVVKEGETVKFTITNRDSVAHNFVSQEANIAYTFLPPNDTQSVVWVAPKTAGSFIALCAFHAGMRIQIVVE